MADETLTIGQLAGRSGVAASALRYWEGVGLLPPPVRVSGQRRYPPSTVELVGVILLLRDVGFSLRDLKALLASATSADGRREVAGRKLAELDERIVQVQAARTAVAHSLACPHEDFFDCPSFTGMVSARLGGASIDEAHRH
ncbi:MerR family transcriptional regulator [Actinomadura meridiana]|uniref:MerR family transcriptional regulator n=1 Tax=Actinomadura meridiana TaxID=559626 RepID=A0ABP8CNS3_9ACTN